MKDKKPEKDPIDLIVESGYVKYIIITIIVGGIFKIFLWN